MNSQAWLLVLIDPSTEEIIRYGVFSERHPTVVGPGLWAELYHVELQDSYMLAGELCYDWAETMGIDLQ